MAWILEAFSLFALIAMLVFLALLTVRPDGTLTVTYARRESEPPG